VLNNAKQIHPKASDVDGYGGAAKEDQAKLVEAWKESRVAEGDIPASARKKPRDAGGAENQAAKKRGQPNKKVGRVFLLLAHTYLDVGFPIGS
jgi:hypothetical protein